MGGYGALKIGMKRPDVFGSLYIMSACCLAANRNPRPETMAAVEAIKTREQAEEAAKAPGFGPSTTLASAAAWSPNPKNPPLFLDLPVKDGKVRPDIVAKWVANSPMEMLEQHVANLGKFYSIAIDIGTKDTLLRSNQELHAAMTKLRVPHYYEEYDGDHTNKVREELSGAAQSDEPADSAVMTKRVASRSAPSNLVISNRVTRCRRRHNVAIEALNGSNRSM
jgi:S-formylglutathione hydrolase FrmB